MPDLPGLVTPEALRSSPPVVDECLSRLQRFTVPFDYNGAPTLTLPCGMSSEGLPRSLQLTGKPHAEPLLCRLGAAYEAATEWHDMHPDLQHAADPTDTALGATAVSRPPPRTPSRCASRG